MKQLLENIQKSIYGPEYYRTLLTRRMSYSWKYYGALALFLAVVLTIVTSIPVIAGLNRVAHELPPKFFAYFPDDLEITITKGHISTNAVEPYFFPIPPELGEVMKDEPYTALAVIDTAHPFSTEQFDAYKSVLWIGQSELAWRETSGKVTIQPLTADANYTINEANLRALEGKVSPYYRLIGPFTTIIIFFALILAFSVNIIYLLFGALLILFMGHLMKQHLTYAQSYQIGLHAMTLPLLFNTLLSLSSFAFLRVPFLFTFIMLAVVYANLKKDVPTLEAAPGIAPPSVTPPPDAKV